MFMDFRKKKSERGMSTVQAAIIATVVAAAAAATSSVMVHSKRQAKIEQLRVLQGQLVGLADFILGSTENLKITMQWNGGGAGNTNYTLWNCFRNDGDGIMECSESVLSNVMIRTLLTGATGEYLVGSDSSRPNVYRVDGSRCVNNTFSDCFLELSFSVKPICEAANDSIFICEQARSFDISYRIRSIRPYNGVTLGEVNKTINLTWDQINRSVVANMPNCDSSRGQIPVGVLSDGSFRCAKSPRNTNIVVKHSMRNDNHWPCNFTGAKLRDGTIGDVRFKNITPSLPSGTRRSFAGLWIQSRVGAGQDLGGSGSCINNSDFMSNFYRECTAAGCSYGTPGDYSIWMRRLDINTADADDIVSFPYDQISECSICEIDGTIKVIHDTTGSASAPECPSGYDRLYYGRSLAAMSTHAANNGGHWSGFNAPQDPSSMGSCLPYHMSTQYFPEQNGLVQDNRKRIPFLQGDHTDATRGKIGFLTNEDFALYYGHHDTAAARYRAYNCSVCWKEAPTVAQPTVVFTNPIEMGP